MGIVIAILLLLILWAIAPELVAALFQLAVGLVILAFWAVVIGAVVLVVASA